MKMKIEQANGKTTNKTSVIGQAPLRSDFSSGEALNRLSVTQIQQSACR